MLSLAARQLIRKFNVHFFAQPNMQLQGKAAQRIKLLLDNATTPQVLSNRVCCACSFCSMCHCMVAFAIRLSTCRLARNCSNDRSRRSVGPQGRGTMRSWILKGSMWEGLHVHASAPQHIAHCRHHGSARFPFLAWLFSFCLMCGEVPSGLALG